MKCGHDDCFTCPYPDCRLDEREACRQYHETHKEAIARRKHEYYEAHKEYRREWQRNYSKEHAEERHRYAQQRWANMTEEEREKERTKNREYYWKKKARIAAELMAQRAAGGSNG